MPTPTPPPFTPVQLQRRRAHGWTPDAQHAFIAALMQCGVVAAAAHSVGLSPRSAYRLRRRAGAESFAYAWDQAMELGLGAMRDRAMDMIHGTREKPLYRHGRRAGTVIAHDERLMLAALRALAADSSGRADRLPHRRRMALHELEDLVLHPERDPHFDGGAIEMPWFDWTSLQRGRAAVDAACRHARLLEAAVEALETPADTGEVIAALLDARNILSR